MKHSQLSFQELAVMLDQFDADRNWLNLSPEDLAKSVMLEGAELLEHFQWDDTIRRRKDKMVPKNTEEIGSEVADILVYLMKFCREMKIDIADATLKKLEKVKKKYPPRCEEGIGHEAYLKIKKEHRKK